MAHAAAVRSRSSVFVAVERTDPVAETALITRAADVDDGVADRDDVDAGPLRRDRYTPRDFAFVPFASEREYLSS